MVGALHLKETSDHLQGVVLLCTLSLFVGSILFWVAQVQAGGDGQKSYLLMLLWQERTHENGFFFYFILGEFIQTFKATYPGTLWAPEMQDHSRAAFSLAPFFSAFFWHTCLFSHNTLAPLCQKKETKNIPTTLNTVNFCVLLCILTLLSNKTIKTL